MKNCTKEQFQVMIDNPSATFKLVEDSDLATRPMFYGTIEQFCNCFFSNPTYENVIKFANENKCWVRVVFPKIQKTVPSDFLNHPYNSVFQNTETEIIARNIMVILSRTGDTFRPITWEEYVIERHKDDPKCYVGNEQEYFDKVIGYLKSADTAVLFSPAWKE